MNAAAVGVLPRLVLLTDRSQLPSGADLVTTVRRCVDVGLRAVVVREHDLPAKVRQALVFELASIDGLTVLSSRIPDAAAAGLHLAAHQEPARGWWGRSCHSRVAVERAAAQGAAWVTLSPYASSVSKPAYGPPLPPTAYANHPLPVLALAGITAANARAARARGAHGVAVMGEVMRSPDPARTVRDLLREVA